MRTHIYAASSIAALALATSAFAQTATTGPQTATTAATDAATNTALPTANGVAPASKGNRDDLIIVTGSRLKRALSDTIEPTQIINAEQIETRGFTNVGQALAELPAIAPGINGVGSAQSGFGAGQTFVDFFGLGTQRTLTLVNGRRFVSSNTASIFGPTGSGGQVDLNTIPVGLIDRIDIVAVGGAPIYGSDAIAGTVNIILKHDFHGLEIEGENGISDRTDAGNYRIRALAGTNFGGGRGNVTASFEYNRQEGLVYNDRQTLAEQRFFTTPPAGSPFQQILIKNRTIPSLSEQGISVRAGLLRAEPGAGSKSQPRRRRKPHRH